VLRRLVLALRAVVLLSFAATPVRADTVRIFCAGAAKAAVADVAGTFERETGHRVELVFDTVGALRDRVLKGERPDLAVLSSAAIQALGPTGLVASDRIVELGRTGVGLAGKPGGPADQVRSVDDLRRLLQGAATIGYADPARGATAGTLFAKALTDLGLAEPLKARLKIYPFGVEAVAAVERGEIEVGVSQATEILTHPVVFLGFLPEPYQAWTPYQAALLSTTGPARLFLDALKAPPAVATLKRVGFE
jgi:molybdate transport system substrate-binding protein